MQDNTHEWQSKPDREARNDEPEQPQVPSSLLSNILHHLELSSEQTPPELSLDDLLLKLRSPSWQDRTLALHSLEKLQYPVSIDLLSPFLQDEDATVRATTLHTLSIMNMRIPLHWLIEALHDTNWHVREVAVFVLAKQGPRIPKEVLMAALHDKDGSVREAANYVLQRNSVDKISSALYGQLREEIPMHHKLYDPTGLNGKHNDHSSESTPSTEWSGLLMEYSSAHPHPVSEQAQAYAAGQYTPHNAVSHEAPSDEYAEIMPSRHEKVTSYRLRRKSHKGWWAAIVVVALLFLGLGRLSTTFVPQIGSGYSAKDVQKMIASANTAGFPTGPDETAIMQNTLAGTLHLTPQQLLTKLRSDNSLVITANNLGVSKADLENSEMNALNTILQGAKSTGQISPADADQWMN